MASIIKGRFIYHAYYNSINELKADTNLEEGYFVSVISDSKKNDYQIVSKITSKEAVYEKLSNGLFALSVILSNETTIDTDKPFRTSGPIEVDVGLLKKGSEFYVKDTNDLLNNMFYNSWCNFTLSTNLGGNLIKGEQNVLSKLDINILRLTERVSKIRIVIGDEYDATIEEPWKVGLHEVSLDLIIRDTSDVIVTIYSELGHSYSDKITIYESYPSYYSVIGAAVEPSPVTIKQMNKVFEDYAETYDNYNNTRFFVAVPVTRELKSLKDESECELKNDARHYTTNITHGLDTVMYNCYYLQNPMLADKFKFSFRTEEL